MPPRPPAGKLVLTIQRNNVQIHINTPRGDKASAMISSLLETAKENGLNPYAYLTYILKNAPNWNIHNDIKALQKLLPSHAPDICKVKTVTD